MLSIGVLALQGAFREHINMLERCGAKASALRLPPDPEAPLGGLDRFDGIVLPGGESTAIGRLLNVWKLMDPLRKYAFSGKPIYGSCAGLILLCRDITGLDGQPSDQPRIGALHACVRRNAFGRQIDSFETTLNIKGVADDLNAVFIRAPVITSADPDVQILAEVETGGSSCPVAVRQEKLLATSCHPELTNDCRRHSYFLEMCR